jgi:putative intracellular protease/amidase
MATPASPPLSYGVLLFPGFEVLDIAGPIECLSTLTHRQQGSSLTLAVIGRPIDDDHPDIPMELTPADPDPTVLGFSFQSQQVYKPTHTFATAPPLDMLLIPGGWGNLPPTKAAPEVAFLKSVYPSLKYLLTICTGSGLAAAAGILDGHRATGNKAVWDRLTSFGPKTYWVAHARWVVSGNIWTTSGVSAGTDGMIAFLASVYDSQLVENVVNSMEYNRQSDPSKDPFATIYNIEDVPPKE